MHEGDIWECCYGGMQRRGPRKAAGRISCSIQLCFTRISRCVRIVVVGGLLSFRRGQERLGCFALEGLGALSFEKLVLDFFSDGEVGLCDIVEVEVV